MTRHIGYKILIAVVLCLLMAMSAIGLYFTQQLERSILHQNQRSLVRLSETTSQSVQAIMLAGSAEIAEDLAHNLKQIEGISDFRLMDRWGEEAFTQNRTINDVNQRIGEDEFTTRDEEQKIIVLEQDDSRLRQAIDSLQIVSYYEQSADGEPLLTLLTPIENKVDCHRCHGGDHPVRGLVKLSSPLTEVYQEINNSWISLIIAMAAITALVMVLIGWLVRRISLPILDAAVQMEAIASGEGDLTVRLPVKGRDEVALLANGFNIFVDKIRQIILDLSGSTLRLKNLSTSLESISSDAQRAAEQQRQDTEQAVAAVSAMKQTVVEVAEEADVAQSKALEVESFAQQGQADVEGTIASIHILKQRVDGSDQAMSELRQVVEKIGEILGMIRSIADQTNLLALNASIEAARAGEQGRGFAVVADEVRTLAGRTRTSTTEIQSFIDRLQASSTKVSELMNECQQQADESRSKADRSGASLQKITEAAHQIAQINTGISQALAESERDTDAINRSIGSISQEALQTSQQSELAHQRSVDLSELVEQLELLVKQFRT